MVIRRIRHLFMLGGIAPLLLLGSLATLYFSSREYAAYDDLIKVRANSAASMVAANSEYGLITGNISDLDFIATRAVAFPDIKQVVIYNNLNHAVARAGKSVTSQESGYTALSPVVGTGVAQVVTQYGFVEVTVDVSHVRKKQAEMRSITLTALLLMSMLSIFVTYRIARSIVNPIERLIHASKEIAYGNSIEIQETSNNELLELERGFRFMANAIARHRAILEEEIRVATINLLSTNQELKEKNQALLNAKEQELKRHIQEFSAFQEGANVLRATLLHNIGNVVAGINSRCESIEEAAASIVSLVNLVGVAIEKSGDLSKEDLLEILRAMEGELLNISREQVDLNAKAIYRSGLHISEIVRDQKTVGRRRDDTEPFSVGELLQDAKTVIQGLPNAGSIDTVIMSDNIMAFNLPKNELMQAVVNLMKNAIESVQERYGAYTSEGLILIRATSISAGWFEIEISDNGRGFESSVAGELFRVGYTTKNSGAGLGLHSTAIFVQSVGGTIRAESDGVNQGASIRMQLPVESLRVRTAGQANEGGTGAPTPIGS